MWKSKLALTSLICMVLASGATAAEFSANKMIIEKAPQAQTKTVQTGQPQPCGQSTPQAGGVCPIVPLRSGQEVTLLPGQSLVQTQPVAPMIMPLDTVQENTRGKITVKYRGVPVTIPASKSTNVIVFPYPIESVGSSKFCADTKYGSNCINPESIGKGEREFHVVPLQNQDTDFVVSTSKQTFIITLRPQLESPAYIEILDESGSSGGQACSSIQEENNSTPYIEYLTELISRAWRGEKIDGFYSNQVSKVYESPNLLFVFKKEIVSTKEPIKIVFIDIINKSKNVLQVREDSKLVEVVLSKIAGKPLAVSLSREFIQPASDETERKNEHISTIVAVVKKQRGE